MPADACVHVIDDDDAMRESIDFLLGVEGLPARLYDSAVAFLQAVEDGLTPGCVVTDIRMPDMTGLELVRRLNEIGVDLPVIVITGHGDIPLAVEAMKAGVVEFIEKPFDDALFLAAVRTALKRMDQRQSKDQERREAEQRLAQLSPRERDVLAGVVAGKPNKIIAYELEISPRTVEVYRANLMTKTGAGSVSDLVRLALAAGR